MFNLNMERTEKAPSSSMRVGCVEPPAWRIEGAEEMYS